MNEIDLANWEPEEPAPEPIGYRAGGHLESMLRRASPYREDKRTKERLEKAVPAKTRRFECPGCGIIKWVEPVYSGDEWHYFGQCSHCGASWVNAFHLMIKCEDCGKKNPITSKNPDGRCNCKGDVRRGKY